MPIAEQIEEVEIRTENELDSTTHEEKSPLSNQHFFNPDEINQYTFPVLWPDDSPKEEESFEAKFFNMLFILGLLIAFMILASWALKRMMKSKVSQLNTASSIKVVESRYLSPKATLHLVEVEDQLILIAESPSAVTHLAAFPLEGGV